MASSKYVEEIQKGVESLINCLICTDKYTNPKILPCQHTFCLPCLEKFYESYTSQRIIRTSNFPCPQCRKNVYIPAGGIDCLPSDFKVGQIQEVFERINFSMVNKEIVICDVCRYDYRNSTAQGFCAQCAKYLCEKCAEQHSGNVLFQSHTLIALGTQNAETLICSEHQEEIKYYCGNCKVALCTVCALGRHSKHETLSLSDTLEQQRTSLQKHLDELRNNLIQHESKAEHLANLHTQQASNIDDVKESISRHAQACIQRVKEDEGRLLNELERSSLKSKDDLDAEIAVINTTVTGIKEALVIAEDLLTNSISLDSITQYDKLEKYFNKNSVAPGKTTPEILHTQFKLLPKTDHNIGHIKIIVNKPKTPEAPLANATSTASIAPLRKTSKGEKINVIGQARATFAKDKGTPSPTFKVEKIISSPSTCGSPKAVELNKSSESTSTLDDAAAAASGFDRPLRSSTPVGLSASKEKVESHTKERDSVKGASEKKTTGKDGAGNKVEPKSPRSSPDVESVRSEEVDEEAKAGPSRFQVKKTDTKEAETSQSSGSASANSSRSNSIEKQKLGTSQDGEGQVKGNSSGSQAAGKKDAKGSLRDTKLLWKTMDRPEARDVDFLPDGSIVVTECREGSDKLQVFDRSGNLKCSVTCSAQNIIRPWGLSVNQQNGYMVVTDHGDRAVKVLDSELSMRSVWRSVFTKPSGVCVMRNGDFAVTDPGKVVGMISVHTQSGICKRSFCDRGSESGECRQPCYIACDHNDRLIVADPELHCIKIFDPRGKQLLKFCAADHPPMNPQGVAVDCHNNILVADQGINTVSLYSPDGRFVQHLAQLKDGPWGIGVHSSGLLAVATDPSLQVFSVPILKA